MSEVELESLRLLIAIDEHSSLGGAARSLGISQPAASARLRAMESRHGLTLALRSARGSQLTEDGKAVCAWARDVLREVNTLEAGISALSSLRRGGLRIAASLTIAEYLMPRWLGELQRTRPDVHAGLHVVNSADVVAMVRDGRVRLGFIEGPATIPDLRMEHVGSDQITVVVRPDHVWAKRHTPIAPEELAAMPLVMREPGSGTRQTFERALGVPPTIAMEAGSTTAVIGGALNGVGPAVVSELATRDAIAGGTLVAVSVSLDLHRPLRAIWRAAERLRSPASDLISIASSTAPDR